MDQLIIVVYVVIAALFLKRNMMLPWLLNPAIWFVLMQIRLTVGSLYFTDTDVYIEDGIYLASCLSLLCFFIIGVELRRTKVENFKDRAVGWHNQEVTVTNISIINIFFIFMIGLSIFVTIAYFYIVGYNVFLLGLTSFLTEMRAEGGLEELRIQSYSTGDYFAPGYVNQFKNTILPILSIYFLFLAKFERRSYRYLLLIILLTINIIGLLGTGQRGPFLYAAVSTIIAYSVFEGKKGSVSITHLSIIILLFLLASLFLGRTTNEISGWYDVWLLINEFVERVFKSNQEGGVVGFRVIYHWPTAFGMEMLNELKGILPGREDYEQYVAHKIHEVLYGSTRGTAPLTLNGDLWMNFNVFGVTIIPAILGYLYQGTYIRLIKGSKNVFRVVSFSFVTISLGFWSAGGVRCFFDDGLVTTLILYGSWLVINKGVKTVGPLRMTTGQALRKMGSSYS